jgi:hypothetical protein
MPKILISTTVRWPSAARLAGALVQSGCEVDALFPDGHPLTASRYPAQGFFYSALRPQRSLAAALAKSRPDLVIACDDRAVAHLQRLYSDKRTGRDMRDLIARSLGNPECYGDLAARSFFIAAAREAGIAAPETIAIDSEAALDAALQHLGLPAVLKADGSWGGDGVTVVRTRDEAKTAWRAMAQAPSRLRSLARAVRRGDAHHLLNALRPTRPSISLQRFVPGTPATTTFACWQGEVIAANHFDVLMTNGASGPASVVKRVEDAAMEQAARRLARRFGLSGLHGLDYVRDAQGAVHLIEINPRATQTSHLTFGPAGDPCAALAARAGTNPPERPPVAGNVVALFPQEWTRDRLSPWLRAASHDVPWDDPRLIDACLGAAPPVRARALQAATVFNGG